MKNLTITFFLCLCILNCYAQDKLNVVYNGIQQARRSGEKFKPVSALTSASRNVAQDRRVEEHFIFSRSLLFGLHQADNKEFKHIFDVEHSTWR